MRILAAILLYFLAVFVFVFEWFREQKSAIYMAWLSSFGEVPEVLNERFNDRI